MSATPEAADHDRRATLLVVGVCALCLLPFLQRPFDLDEILFLTSAQHLQTRPADPFGCELNWYGEAVPLYTHINQPPLNSYLLALCIRLLGADELRLHAAYALLALALALGTARLARQLSPGHPVAAALAGLLGPGYIVSGSLLMADVLMAALWVWAVHWWLQGERDGRDGRLVVAAVAAALCTLTKFHGIALAPLLAAISVMHHHGPRRRLLLLLLPPAALLLSQVHGHALYGVWTFAQAGAFAELQRSAAGTSLVARVLTAASFVGGCVPAAVLLLPLVWRPRQLLWLLPAALGIGLLALALSFGDWQMRSADGIHWLQLILFTVYALGGLNLLILAAQELKHRDAASLALALWLSGIFVFAAVLNWTVSARSVVLLAPVGGLLLLRRIGTDQVRPVAALIAVGAVLGLLAAEADLRFARNQETAAEVLVPRYLATDRTVWIQGHWAFQYYGTRLGAQPVDLARSRLRVGDVVLIPHHSYGKFLLSAELWRPLELPSLPGLTGVTTMNADVGAGYHASRFGPLPVVYGVTSEDLFLVFEMTGSTDLGNP